MRAIDADALLDDLNIDIGDTTVGKRHYVMTWEIEEAPTLDVSERESGEWVKSEIPNELYVCSECGGACWSYDYERNIVKSNFCPNCGADMRGEEE